MSKSKRLLELCVRDEDGGVPCRFSINYEGLEARDGLTREACRQLLAVGMDVCDTLKQPFHKILEDDERRMFLRLLARETPGFDFGV